MNEMICKQAQLVTEEVCRKANLEAGDLFVVGCSSSEVLGQAIGTNSSIEIAQAIYIGVQNVLLPRGIFLAAQCCEHLNRALIVEYDACARFGLEPVNVVPQPKAGGSFATTAYQRFKNPVAVESLCQRASAGIDIGGTLIGMHIRPVVVPIRCEHQRIGEASVICARRRPKFVGGERAKYDEALV